ncbi:MAG: ABC transporter permease, partial [Parachlamydiaceae bacterium]
RSKKVWVLLLLMQLAASYYVITYGVRNPAFQTQDVNVYVELNQALKETPQSPRINHKIMPLLSPYHWEEDPGEGVKGYTPRINGKDLTSALIFGTRISLVVGILSCGIALIIGLPIGAYAGYYGGRFDLVVCRFIEIWESMPAFFMLLFAVAILQSKSIFIVITLIALFGWTGFSRYMRGECLKQRALAYVEAGRAIGYSDTQLLFKEILPNAIAPIITLLPFAIMGAISSEAGLSFLGLGEEGSTSWGILMDEGRSAFPARAYLLWPPAILLTLLLVAIALVGDALRNILDPKLQ